MHEAEFTERALLDLRSIQLHYLVNADESAAQKHIGSILEGIGLIQELPQIGRAIEDPQRIIGPGYRKHLAGGFWIVYSVSPEKVTVWRVYHERQDVDDYAFIDL